MWYLSLAFTDEGARATTFRESVGMTPLEYRECDGEALDGALKRKSAALSAALRNHPS